MNKNNANITYPISPPVPSHRLRYGLAVVLSLLFIACMYFLVVRLISDFEYFHANNLMEEKNYKQAIVWLEKAVALTPEDYKKQQKLARAYHEYSGEVKKAADAFGLARRSKDAGVTALLLNENEAYSAYLLARSEQRLEQLHQYLYPEKTVPYNPLPFYRRAVFLWPSSVLYHLQMARNLYRHQEREELLQVVRKLAGNNPPVYSRLKKEEFWSDTVKTAFKKGLEQAIAQKTDVRSSYGVYAQVMASEKNWPGAVSYYKKALRHQPYLNHSHHHIHLGYLYLKDLQFAKAEEAFLAGLKKSSSLNRDMERIYSIYKREQLPDRFYALFQQVAQRFILPSETEILMARSLMDAKKNKEAEAVLRNLVAGQPSADAYYWIARIAEIEKDWDKMELAGQKTTVLEPENSHFHYYFSRALQRKKKLERAEKEAGLALKHSQKPNAWLFSHRGWIRWNRNDFLGAARDFKRAIGIQPEKPYFYAYAAQAYKRAGDWDLARQYYEKALQRDPDNADYKKKLDELTKNNH